MKNNECLRKQPKYGVLVFYQFLSFHLSYQKISRFAIVFSFLLGKLLINIILFDIKRVKLFVFIITINFYSVLLLVLFVKNEW